MKNKFTLRLLMLLALPLLFYFPANAQFNWAQTDSFRHGGPGVNGSGGSAGWGEELYNDNARNFTTIPPYGTSQAGEFTFVSNNGWIKSWWDFAATVGYIDKVVFYKNDRPMLSCMMLHWNGATWDTVTIRHHGVETDVYYETSNNVVDSFDIVGCKHHNHLANTSPTPNGSIEIFPSTIGNAVDTIMFVNIDAGQNTTASFREIQFWKRSGCTGVGTAQIVAGFGDNPPTAAPTINICPGYDVYFHASSNWTDTGHRYQWQIKVPPATAFSNIPGEIGPGYVFNNSFNATVRLIDSCVTGGGPALISNEIAINVSQNYYSYTNTGYLMTFDNAWVSSSCLPAPFARDLPDIYWSNSPPYGTNTWRIDTASTGTSGWTTSPASGNFATAKNAACIPYGVVRPAATRYAARLHTAGLSFLPGSTGNLDLHVDFSGVTANKAMYFYYTNTNPFNYDSLNVLLSTNAGQTWTKLGTFDTSATFKKRMVPIQSNSAQTIVRFQGIKVGSENSDIGLDSVFIAPPCSGTPTAGNIKPHYPMSNKTVTVCAGATIDLTTLGATVGGDLIYEWQQNTNGVSWTPVNGGIGSDNLFFVTPPIYDTVQYRLALKCGASGTVVYSDTLTVNISGNGPSYASLPYRQNFESWGTACSPGDVPLSANNVINWANGQSSGYVVSNVPTTSKGNASWRIENNSSTTSNWSNIGVGLYSPPSASLLHSARFHSNGAWYNQKGNLDLLFNGSSVNGPKEVRFYYINTGGFDSLQVYYSSDAGNNFTKLGGYKTNNGWTQYTVQAPCSTPNCVIRFQGSGSYGDQSDIGLDSVTVTNPCNAMPNAGTLSFANPCPGATFTLSLTGNSNSGGLVYYWEKSTDSIFWSSVYPVGQNDTTKTFFTTNISQNTWFRVRVKCLYTGQESMTVRKIKVAEFYYCYCGATATSSAGADIGNVNIKRLPAGTNLLNNGTATPQNNNGTAIGTYSDFRVGNPNGGVTPLYNPQPSHYPTPIYHDTSYTLLVSQINSGSFTPSTVTVWIDTDRNGFFDNDEIFLQQTTSITSLPPQRVDVTFALPPSTPVGITGMRVMLEQGSNVTSVPCGPIANGEVEDYLIEVRDHPCTGPASAGIVEQSDTTVCVNYTVKLTDTTHATKQYGLSYVWQYSPDSNSWADIAGSAGKDTVSSIITAQTYYRVRMVCLVTFDTVYSNVVKVAINPPYACYCYSLANGGTKDTSDIGAVTFANFYTAPQGPHLQNQWAIEARTDWTKLDTLHLWVDTTYQLLVYHTMKSVTHGDAKITLFMDLNSDLQYNTGPGTTNERLWTGYTTSTYFTVIDSITIPHYAFPGVLTGMRIILNNDTGPNVPSDSACGPYVSGETEDYVVMFHDPLHPWPINVGVQDPSKVSIFRVYPNPTTGTVNVNFEATRDVEEATITVTNVTGQVVLRKAFAHPGKSLNESLDLTHVAAGVYIVELKADDERKMNKLIVR